MKIEYTNREVAGVVTLIGRVDGDSARRLREALRTYLEETPYLLIDCDKLSYLDSSGLGALLFGLKNAVAAGGDVRLAAVAPKVRMILEVTKTVKLFRIYSTVSGAETKWLQTLTPREMIQ